MKLSLIDSARPSPVCVTPDALAIKMSRIAVSMVFISCCNSTLNSADPFSRLFSLSGATYKQAGVLNKRVTNPILTMGQVIFILRIAMPAADNPMNAQG